MFEKVLFFDAGHTLVNMFGIPKNQLFNLFSEKIIGVNEDRNVELAVKATEVFYQHSCFIPGYLNSQDFWWEYYSIGLKHLGYNSLESIELAKVISTQKIDFSFNLVEGCLEMLNRLSVENYRLAIISNWDGSLEKTLDNLNILSFFDYVADSGKLKIEKPAKDIFEFALKKMNCSAQNSVYIGDLYYYDIMPAKSIGMKTILFDSVDALEGEFDSIRITRLNEIPKILYEWKGVP